MIIKQLVDEDFVNYKKPSMFIGFPKCSWKCEYECGQRVCQNSALATTRDVFVAIDSLVNRYIVNPITSAIVFGGLEPFDTFDDLLQLVDCFRETTEDDIVIYTGYYEDEIFDKVEWLKKYKNIIIKFGRFIPNQEKHYDEILGIYLASDNQYGKRLS